MINLSLKQQGPHKNITYFFCKESKYFHLKFIDFQRQLLYLCIINLLFLFSLGFIRIHSFYSILITSKLFVCINEVYTFQKRNNKQITMPGGMTGGFSQQNQVNDDHKNMVNQLKGQINQKIGANHNSFKIDKVFTQVVAGIYYHFHLTADNGEKISALVFQPLPHTNEPARVQSVEKGHTQARNPN